MRWQAMRTARAALLLLLACALAAPAWAQTTAQLQQQINNLSNRVRRLVACHGQKEVPVC